MAVATVGGGFLTCFMCHGSGSLNGDGLDLDDRQFLAMATFTLHAFALLLLENDDLLGAFVLQHLGGDGSADEKGGSNLESGAFARGEDFVDLNRGTCFSFG